MLAGFMGIFSEIPPTKKRTLFVFLKFYHYFERFTSKNIFSFVSTLQQMPQIRRNITQQIINICIEPLQNILRGQQHCNSWFYNC